MRFIILVFLAGCTTSHDAGPKAWLLQRGKQMHKVEVTRKQGEGPNFMSFTAIAELSDTEAHLTALSPLGTTLFKVDDERSGDFKMHSLSPMVKDKTDDLKKLYARLRKLFWAHQGSGDSGVTVIEANQDSSTKKLLWNLGPYAVFIEVSPL